MRPLTDACALARAADHRRAALEPEGYVSFSRRHSPYMAAFLAGASAPVDLLYGLTEDSMTTWPRATEFGFVRDRFAIAGDFWRAIAAFESARVEPHQERLFELSDVGGQ